MKCHTYFDTDCVNCLREEIDQLRVQLAGCGVAALGGTTEPVLAHKGDWGWSPSYQDVLDLRLKFDRLMAVDTHTEHDPFGWTHDSVIGGRIDDETILEDRVPEVNPIGKVRSIKQVTIIRPEGVSSILVPGEIKYVKMT